MRILKSSCFFCVLFLMSFVASAQYNTDIGEIINYSSGVQSFDSRFKGVEGSSYLNDEFLPVKINNSEKVYFLRYNAFENEMEFKKDKKLHYLIKKAGFEIVFVDSNKLYRVFEFNDDKAEKGFFVVLFKGNSKSLLVKEQIKFYEEVKPKSGYDKYKPPTLKREKDEYYFSDDYNLAKKIPVKKKEFFSIFGSKSSDVEKFVKTNKFNIKSTEDLVEIFKFYNQLN